METFRLPTPAYPADLCSISMALFHDVPDAAGLRARLISASTMQGAEGNAERAKVDFAFLDARSIACRDQVLIAAHQAILSAVQGELRTQTVHSDLIDNLNPTGNVAESLRRFGISAKSTSALLVRIGPALGKDEEAALQSEMSQLVKVQPVSLDKLSETVDRAGLRKIFKTGNDELSDGLIMTYTALNKTIGIF